MPRRSLLVALLGPIALTSACRHAKDPSLRPPEVVSPPPTAPEITEWLLGEQVRGTKTRNRGDVGIVTYPVGAESPTPTQHPETCAPDLVQIIPTPARADTWFAIDESGTLLRHSDASWSPVPAAEPIVVPPIDKLIAFAKSSSRLELLAGVRGQERELFLITIDGERVIGLEVVERSTFKDHRDTLQRYDSGRCIEGARACLHITATDDGLVLMLEPQLFDFRVEVPVPLKPGVRDVRYADLAGTTVHVLTPEACSAAPDPGPDSEPSPQPEAVP